MSLRFRGEASRTRKVPERRTTCTKTYTSEPRRVLTMLCEAYPTKKSQVLPSDIRFSALKNIRKSIRNAWGEDLGEFVDSRIS